MKVHFRSSFVRDLKKIRDPLILDAVREAIEQVEGAQGLEDILHLRKLSGSAGFFRIRLGDYRIGLAVGEDGIECVRFLHRRDIYKHFP